MIRHTRKFRGFPSLKILILGLFAIQPVFAQKSITIEECQQKARDNYPLIHQYGLLELSEQYTVSNIGKTRLPQIAVNVQATYQSDVVRFPIDLPGIDIPTIDKDQYKATIDVSQAIWDGGTSRFQKKIARAGNEVERQNLEVNLYTLRERVNQLFFGILTIDEQLKQLDILEQDLQTSLKLVNSFLKNGTATQSDADAILVEILNTGQKRVELSAFRTAYLEMLSAMIGETPADDTRFVKPKKMLVNQRPAINRPEMLLFDKQRELFDAQENGITARNMPKFSLFVQGGYGKPGLNMLSNDFEFFYVGGIRLNWNFGNLYTSKNDRDVIYNDKNMVETQRETFMFNTNLQLMQTWREILKAKELMERDEEIIALRERVKTAAESKYKNGVYTVNDLIKDINAESRSRQEKILHEVQYLMSVYDYMTIAGN